MHSQGEELGVLTQTEIVEALRALGLRAGTIVFVHSSLRSLGYVDGGTDTVVDALLEVLGPAGTLVVPTFTFYHGPGKSPDPVFDPRRDPSTMGKITEAVRRRSDAQRSCHLLHSVAALGPKAIEVTAHHGPSAWAADGPFWKLYELDARILLLGVPYLRCTFFHLVEQFVQVSYRQWLDVEARLRDSEGVERPLPTRAFRPGPGFVGNDFNKLGGILEERGLVRRGAVGNAVARIFRTRDAFDVGVAEYRKDALLFVKTGEGFTLLNDGVLTEDAGSEKAVFDPSRIYPKRRPAASSG